MKHAWLALFSAGLRVASLPGWVFGPLAFLAVVPRIAYWERGGGRLGDWLGGMLFWVATFSFLSHTFWALPLGPAPFLGLWWVGEGWLYGRLRRRLPVALAAPLALAPVEFLRGIFPMGGVPWAAWSLGLGEHPALLLLARACGEAGLALLVMTAGAWVYCLARRRHAAELLVAPGLLLVLMAVARIGPALPEEPPTVRCLAVQPNITIGDKTERDRQERARLDSLRLARGAVAGVEKPELLFWSETMFLIPALPPDAVGVLRIPRRGLDSNQTAPARDVLEIQRYAVRRIHESIAPGGYFLTGAHFYETLPEDSGDDEISPRTSRTLAFDGSGDLVGSLAKTELVPFGERLPLLGAFPFSHALARWIFDVFGLYPTFRLGAEGEPLVLPLPDGDELVLGSTICWENVFARLFRRQAKAGAEAFCVLSNENWFGEGAEMDQMLSSTRFRAVETGRAILRVTNTGLTVLVDARGEARESLPRGVSGTLLTELPRSPRDHWTPYLMGGWLLLPAVAVLGLLLAAWPARGRGDRS